MSFNMYTAHFQHANPGGEGGQNRLEDSMRKALKWTIKPEHRLWQLQFACLCSHLLGAFVLNKSPQTQDVGVFMGLPPVVPQPTTVQQGLWMESHPTALWKCKVSRCSSWLLNLHRSGQAQKHSLCLHVNKGTKLLWSIGNVTECGCPE